MNVSIFRTFCSVLICGALSACVIPAQIETNKAASYTDEPKRIFVITDIGSEWGKDFANGFQQKMTSIAKVCGADSQFLFVSGLELDSVKPDAQMQAFHPDTLLSIKRVGYILDPTGKVVVTQNYDVRLLDVKTNKTVWRANMKFSGTNGEMISSLMYSKSERGESLAMDMTNRMKDDKIFRSCSKYASLKDTPASIPAQSTAPTATFQPAVPIATITPTIQQSAANDSNVESSIDLPDGWATARLSDALKAKHFTFHATNQGNGATLLISSKKRADVADIQKYAEIQRNAQMNSVVDGKQSEIEMLKMNDLSAWRFTVQGVGKASGKDLTWLITVIENGNKISILTVGAPTDHFSDNRDAFNKLAYLVH
ncbi:hypothetical protein [Solimicrobium silvestre]|uniref:Uncharacterized protein n=1 Tax=Solimicrobium silvestre TaxID=2099400 RepID=A0A2S9GVP6_9BURK|nr:hypothetical protein [Solimicrobium silvestre]PRC91792.1 hypothetical protein S2091_3547 [Solimicrobium silvestre]